MFRQRKSTEWDLQTYTTCMSGFDKFGDIHNVSSLCNHRDLPNVIYTVYRIRIAQKLRSGSEMELGGLAAGKTWWW